MQTKIALQNDPGGPIEVDGKNLTETEFINLQKMYPHIDWIVIKFVEPEDYKYPGTLNTKEDET